MYEGNLAVDKHQSIFLMMKESFSKELSQQSELLERVQDKLNELLDRRNPEKPPSNNIPSISNDFNSEMGAQLERLRTNNNKLDKIINHLQEIL